MALVTRLSRLFQADFHAVLDRIEEPELQLRQAVREMQYALDQDRQRLQLLAHEAARLDKAIGTGETALAAYDDELDICLSAKKDDLARDLLRRKLTTDKQLLALRQQVETVAAQRQTLGTRVAEQEEQMTSMEQKLELLVSEDDGFNPAGYAQTDSIRNEEIEIALLREKERRAKS